LFAGANGSELFPLRLDTDTETVRSGAACQECQGLSVDFFSSFLIVPSGDSVTLFSFFSTVPSLLTFSLSVLETVRSQPIVSTDSASADIIAINVILPVFIVSPFYVCSVFSFGFDQALAERWTRRFRCAARRLTRPFGGVLGYLDHIVMVIFAARKSIILLAHNVPPTRASVFQRFSCDGTPSTIAFRTEHF
jgi:hypothetical protein